MLCVPLLTNIQNTSKLSPDYPLFMHETWQTQGRLICTHSAFTMSAMMSGVISFMGVFFGKHWKSVRYLTTLSQEMFTVTAIKHVGDDNFVFSKIAHRSETHGIYRWRRCVVVSGVRRMNKVNARRARLVPRWVTVFGRVYYLGV